MFGEIAWFSFVGGVGVPLNFAHGHVALAAINLFCVFIRALGIWAEWRDRKKMQRDLILEVFD